MGTSKGYAAPTGGAWTKLKGDVTRLEREAEQHQLITGSRDPRIGSILGQLIAALGGAASIAGTAHRARQEEASTAIGARAAHTAASLGAFNSAVSGGGFAEGLQSLDFFDDLAGRSADEVVEGLVERLAGVPSGFDEAAAQEALILLLNELRGDATTLEELEAAYLRATELYGLRGLLVRYFGFYLYVLFCQRFVERLNRDPAHMGTSPALVAHVRDYILLAVEEYFEGADINRVDWTGTDGIEAAEQILRDTLEIFEALA